MASTVYTHCGPAQSPDQDREGGRRLRGYQLSFPKPEMDTTEAGERKGAADRHRAEGWPHCTSCTLENRVWLRIAAGTFLSDDVIMKCVAESARRLLARTLSQARCRNVFVPSLLSNLPPFAC
jgi:hypothetical protein